MKWVTSPKYQRGISLISVIVAAGISAVVIAALFSSFSSSFKASKSVDLRTDLTAIKRSLIGRVSCRISYSASTCTSPGQIVELTTDNSQILIGRDTVTRFGDWAIRAECASSLDGIIVRAAMLKQTGTLNSVSPTDFREDPLTHKVVTWASPESLLFPSGVYICPSANNFSSTLSPSSYFVHASEDYVRNVCGGFSFSSATSLSTQSLSGPTGIADRCARKFNTTIPHNICVLSFFRDGDGGGYCRAQKQVDGRWSLAAFSNDSRGNSSDPFGVACEFLCF